jgi:hypothetical protein
LKQLTCCLLLLHHYIMICTIHFLAKYSHNSAIHFFAKYSHNSAIHFLAKYSHNSAIHFLAKYSHDSTMYFLAKYSHFNSYFYVVWFFYWIPQRNSCLTIGVFQQICLTSYCFSSLRGPKGTNSPQNYFLSLILMGFPPSKFLMKFFPLIFKQIIPSDY